VPLAVSGPVTILSQPSPAGVPLLGNWGVVALAVLLIAASAVFWRHRSANAA